MKTIAASLIVAAFTGSAFAQVTLFNDTFDRTDSRDIQASLSGITDNTGSSLAAGGVYSQPWLDPNNASPTFGAQDGDAANGGGAQILGNVLQLAVGAGTSSAYVNHNFVNASILSAGGFRVSLDVTGYNQTSIGQGGAFAVGMSAADAASSGDAFGDSHPSMTRAFHTGSSIGSDISTTGSQPVVSDFWVALRGNSSLVWGSSSGTIAGVTGLAAKTGIISADFLFSDFNAGSTVNVEIFYNGVSQGNGSFVWSGNAENYIGLNGRDSGFVGLDNFLVTTVPEPSTFVLSGFGLLVALGILRHKRRTAA